jgi:tetratricopeptide (TPR) repeat protein
MVMKLRFVFVISLVTVSVAGVTAMQQPTNSDVPKTSATSPGGCLQEVRDYATKRQQEMIAATAPSTPPATGNASAALAQQRSDLVVKINQARIAMAKECAERVSARPISDKDLVSMADLYNEGGQADKAKETIAHALSLKSVSPTDRAAVLVYAIRAGLREPITSERNNRLERYVDELDRSAAASSDQKLDAHVQMNNYYRYDDIDSGIIRHSTWIIEYAKKLSPDPHQKIGSAAANAYVNMAQAWAGQGMNDKALALLDSAKTDLKDNPNIARSVDPEIALLKLVGTPAAAITAPRWLNMPQGKTELAMPGSVTLLEFSAHWCTPCKESYPGVNRLRTKYGSKGFRVVLATQLYGYFEGNRNITADMEVEYDRKYFAEHGLDVPIAIGPESSGNARDLNEEHYKVGGIPQIHLIDKKGRIRLVMVGYDDANEPKLGKLIEGLLNE